MTDLLLVVDFDGTVYRGDAAASRYAGRIAAALPPAEAERYLAAFEGYAALGVAAAAAPGTDPADAAVLRACVDLWDAAARLALRHGIGPEVTEPAFAATRRDMLDPSCELEVVIELLDTLAAVRGAARVVLATNSPRDGLEPLLGRLGVAGAFDEVVPGAGKPAGLRRLLARELGADLAARPWRAFSLGDHYPNEIAPAVEIGAAAGYIDRFGRADGPATASAPVVEELLPAIHAWIADPQAAAVRVR
jgi:FMN phosphatase YigB (HAD superfamily)